MQCLCGLGDQLTKTLKACSHPAYGVLLDAPFFVPGYGILALYSQHSVLLHPNGDIKMPVA